MTLMKGLPPYLDLVKIATEHPMRLVRSFVIEKAHEIQQNIEKHVYYYKCPGCGHIALFERLK
ncbi:MAG: hypothetical protein QW223_01250 [Candidatus Caldarchaeum sp.]